MDRAGGASRCEVYTAQEQTKKPPSPSISCPTRFLDLGPHLRPEAQADQAVDLNLRLMRWRAVPELEVGAMAATKCLLLGGWTRVGGGGRRGFIIVAHTGHDPRSLLIFVVLSSPIRSSLFYETPSPSLAIPFVGPHQ